MELKYKYIKFPIGFAGLVELLDAEDFKMIMVEILRAAQNKEFTTSIDFSECENEELAKAFFEGIRTQLVREL